MLCRSKLVEIISGGAALCLPSWSGGGDDDEDFVPNWVAVFLPQTSSADLGIQVR